MSTGSIVDVCIVGGDVVARGNVTVADGKFNAADGTVVGEGLQVPNSINANPSNPIEVLLLMFISLRDEQFNK